MIIVIHNPKTGGMSFRSFLVERLGHNLFQDYGSPPIAAGLWGRLWRLCGRPGRIPWNIQCIMGHFHRPRYEKQYPQARYAIWLRDPVERLISSYLFHKRGGLEGKSWITQYVQKHDLSLEQYAELKTTTLVNGRPNRLQVANVQSQYAAGWPLSTFAFVGITERFDLGLQLFARVFGLKPPEQSPQVNLNPERRGKSYEIAPEVREHIRKLNHEDEKLYQEGLHRFRELCQAHGLGDPTASRRAA